MIEWINSRKESDHTTFLLPAFENRDYSNPLEVENLIIDESAYPMGFWHQWKVPEQGHQI